jgi:hypothetical protein
MSVKDLGNTFDINPKWERTVPSFGNFALDIYRVPCQFQISKLILPPYCGLKVQDPTQTLRSVKDPGNTFDLNPKWERTLPSLGNFAWDIYRVSCQIHISKLIWTPCCGLKVQDPTQALKSDKDQSNTFDINSKWERTFPSLDNFAWDMHTVPRLIQISQLIFDTLLWA